MSYWLLTQNFFFSFKKHAFTVVVEQYYQKIRLHVEISRVPYLHLAGWAWADIRWFFRISSLRWRVQKCADVCDINLCILLNCDAKRESCLYLTYTVYNWNVCVVFVYYYNTIGITLWRRQNALMCAILIYVNITVIQNESCLYFFLKCLLTYY